MDERACVVANWRAVGPQCTPARRRAAAAAGADSPPLPPPQPLQVVFVTTEVAPWSKVGGLGDVMASLPTALASR